ncbi:ATP-dependent zinc metalloprotease FTSH 4 mitochondrial-like, partial [Trifolium medium]|nr:ATP-dependent zinc metalloprotease FTSH 4 mitochondrial-like [Trifolium medium]
TFDQLLVELDGLKQNDCIIVIAATHVPDSLHTSLVKNGRFDRRVDVPKPGEKEKLQILESLMSKVSRAKDGDLDIIIDMSHHFSGADLANMVNNAALEAARNCAYSVTLRNMSSAMRDIKVAKGYPIKSED